jgi:hypothetical protein
MKHFSIALLTLVFALSSGSAFASLTQTEVSQLYIGVFGRASEGSGNSYWQSDPQSTSMTATANVMLGTDPAKAYFGDTMNNNGAFVAHIYWYTLGKSYADDPNGQDYWVSELVAGKAKGEMIAALISAAQHPDNAGEAQDRFNNKVEVSNYCANNIFEYTDLATFTDFLSSVTGDASSVASAKALIDTQKSNLSCVNLNGANFSVTEIRYLQDCGGPTDNDYFTVSVNQSGCSATFLDSYGIWGIGTISGNQATITSSWYESGGSVNAVYDVTFSDDTSYVQGTGVGTWTDGYSSCSATSSISGTRY